MKRLLNLGVSIIVGTFVGVIASIWWWALFGMSDNVATAWILTWSLTFALGCAMCFFYADSQM